VNKILPSSFQRCQYIDRDDLLMPSILFSGTELEKGSVPLISWMLENGYAQSVQCRVNSLVGMVAAVREGLGIAALPCYLGDMEPGLIRLGAVIPELSTDLWLLAHTDLRKNTRMRITLDYLATSIRDKRERVECA
jgi:DNA-binding transcriptional LysR family regulator